mmetsp:Transcript_17501/g.40258  ORF Transcript_17501/g.40258 Transcript_17501/m.40258 type:complete len:196 (+) Transcript_17501:120-707(+)
MALPQTPRRRLALLCATALLALQLWAQFARQPATAPAGQQPVMAAAAGSSGRSAAERRAHRAARKAAAASLTSGGRAERKEAQREYRAVRRATELDDAQAKLCTNRANARGLEDPDFLRRVVAGASAARRLSIVFAGLVHRKEAGRCRSLELELDTFRRLGRRFRDYRVVLYESNSHRDTRAQVARLCQADKRVG